MGLLSIWTGAFVDEQYSLQMDQIILDLYNTS